MTANILIKSKFDGSCADTGEVRITIKKTNTGYGFHRQNRELTFRFKTQAPGSSYDEEAGCYSNPSHSNLPTIDEVITELRKFPQSAKEADGMEISAEQFEHIVDGLTHYHEKDTINALEKLATLLSVSSTPSPSPADTGGT